MAKLLKRLLTNSSGNIAVLSGLLAVPLFSFAGLALDLAALHNSQIKMQSAADAAALAVAAEANTMNSAELNTAIEEMYTANGGYKIRTNHLSVTGDYKNSIVEVTASANIPTFLMGILQFSNTDVSVVSQATAGTSGISTEMSLVIDNTSSMNFGSWEQVSQALSEVLEAIESQTENGEFHVTLVPYTDRVNIGTARESWLSARDRSGTWEGCVEPLQVPEPGLPYALDLDAAPRDFSPTTEATTAQLLANGAKGSECAAQIIGPTSDITIAQNGLRNLEPKLATGRFDDALAWGWRTVSQDWQGRWGHEPDYPSRNGERSKIVALFTDGLTNINQYEMEQRSGEHGNNRGSNSLFAHFRRVCDAMIADNVDIYIFDTARNKDITDTFNHCARENYYQVRTTQDMIAAIQNLTGGSEDIVRLIK